MDKLQKKTFNKSRAATSVNSKVNSLEERKVSELDSKLLFVVFNNVGVAAFPIDNFVNVWWEDRLCLGEIRCQIKPFKLCVKELPQFLALKNDHSSFSLSLKAVFICLRIGSQTPQSSHFGNTYDQAI